MHWRNLRPTYQHTRAAPQAATSSRAVRRRGRAEWQHPDRRSVGDQLIRIDLSTHVQTVLAQGALLAGVRSAEVFGGG
jgi:hypothetical protein